MVALMIELPVGIKGYPTLVNLIDNPPIIVNNIDSLR